MCVRGIHTCVCGGVTHICVCGNTHMCVRGEIVKGLGAKNVLSESFERNVLREMF